MLRRPPIFAGVALAVASAGYGFADERAQGASSSNCVTTGTPPASATYTYRTRQGGAVTTFTYRWPEMSSEGSRLEVDPVQPLKGQSRVVTATKHRFEDDLVLVDSYTTSGTNVAGPFTSRTVHRPALVSGPALRVCRGKTWRTPPVQVTTTSSQGRASTDRVSISGEVVGIHERVTVEAGTFDTVHFRQTHSSSQNSVVVDVWRSIDEGVTVRMESTAGGVTVLQTLIARRR